MSTVMWSCSSHPCSPLEHVTLKVSWCNHGNIHSMYSTMFPNVLNSPVRLNISLQSRVSNVLLENWALTLPLPWWAGTSTLGTATPCKHLPPSPSPSVYPPFLHHGSIQSDQSHLLSTHTHTHVHTHIHARTHARTHAHTHARTHAHTHTHTHTSLEGIVVAKEYEEVLLEAWEQEEQVLIEKEMKVIVRSQHMWALSILCLYCITSYYIVYCSIEARATGVGEMAQAHERTADQRKSQEKI